MIELLDLVEEPRVDVAAAVATEAHRLRVSIRVRQRLWGETRESFAERAAVEEQEIVDVLGRVITSPDYSQWPPPEWVQRAVERHGSWTNPADERTPQEKTKSALFAFMVDYVRTEQGKRRKGVGATP